MPTPSEMRAPYTSLVHTSRPKRSVPSAAAPAEIKVVRMAVAPSAKRKTGCVDLPLSRFRDLLPSRHGRSRMIARPGVHSF